MKRIVTFLAGLTFILILIAPAAAQNHDLTLLVSGMKESVAPFVFGDSIVLSYRFPGEVRPGQIHTVQASFEHENYSRLYPFSRNEEGLYVLVLETPTEVETLRYRLIVDGLWTVDPNSPATITDRWGVRISEFAVPNDYGHREEFPAVLPEGLVEFRILANSGRSVALVGSFNGWDPFMTPMTETQPGIYTRVVRLTRGEHLYYFMVDGLKLPDPGNAARRWNVDGMAVSVVQLP